MEFVSWLRSVVCRLNLVATVPSFLRVMRGKSVLGGGYPDWLHVEVERVMGEGDERTHPAQRNPTWSWLSSGFRSTNKKWLRWNGIDCAIDDRAVTCFTVMGTLEMLQDNYIDPLNTTPS